MLHPVSSGDSLSTLLTSDNDDATSLFSLETLSVAAFPVFGKPLLTYSRIRTLPLVVGPIKMDIQLFLSVAAMKNGDGPLFSVQLNMLRFFKKNAPLLTIYIHRDGTKSEFAKVYFKILRNNLTSYVIMFTDGKKAILYNNALKPHTDAMYKNTKLRMVGISSASAFSNSSLRLFVLKPESPTLVDGLPLSSLDAAQSIKDVDLSKNDPTPLFDAVVQQNRTKVLKLLGASNVVVNVPLVSFTDQGDTKIEGVRVAGLVRLFESTIDSGETEPSPDSLVLITMLMTLLEQETRKLRGSNKPLYV